MDPVDVGHADGDILPGGATYKHLQNCGDGVQAMTGIQRADRRGIHTEDDRVRTEFQVEAERTGAMLRVR